MNFPDELPQRLWRFPTKAAMAHLANRFNLPLEDWMQDWEYTAPKSEQFSAYLAAYRSGELNDDQRFLLMEMMIQCAEDEADKVHLSSVLQLLEEDVELHLASIWYWACLDSKLEWAWDIAPEIRAILWRHRHLWQ